MIESDVPDHRIVRNHFPDHARGLLDAILKRLSLHERLALREMNIDDYVAEAEGLHDYIVEHGQACYTAARYLSLPTDPTPVLNAINWDSGDDAGIGPGLERAFHTLRALICDSEAMQSTATALSQTKPVDVPAAAKAGESDKANPTNSATNRGRLPKEESEAKRAHFLATIKEHPSLKDDPATLSTMVRVSESTIRRWTGQEEQAYFESRPARTPDDQD